MAVSANRLELLQIADAVARDKSIDRSIVLASMEDAMAKAARSRYGQETEIRVEIDPRTGETRYSRLMLVVDEVHDVFGVPLGEIRPPPRSGEEDLRALGGVLQHNRRMTFILDLERLQPLLEATEQPPAASFIAVALAPDVATPATSPAGGTETAGIVGWPPGVPIVGRPAGLTTYEVAPNW